MNDKPKPGPHIGTKYLIVEINEETSIVEAVGFNGQGCHAASKPFEDALGGKVTDRKEKPPEGAAVCVKI